MRAISLLSLLLCACGFLRESPFSGRRSAQVAPFEDLGPLEICDGPVALSSSTIAPTGWCVVDPVKKCDRDSDCQSREHCQCSECRIAPCTSNAACRKNEKCSFDDGRCDRVCQIDADCSQTEYCVPVQNICRAHCKSASDCQYGEQCRVASGECVAIVCSDDSVCAVGASCTLLLEPASLAHPAPLVEHEQVTLWLERDGAVWRAQSRDGEKFSLEPRHALLSGGAPAIAFGDRYTLLFANAGDLYRADSADGIAFDAPRLAIADASLPSLLLQGDGLIAYLLQGGEVVRYVDSGGGWSRAQSVLTPSTVTDPTYWRSVDALGAIFVEHAQDGAGADLTRLWFSAHGQESESSMQFGAPVPTPPDFSVGLATSTDGNTFSLYPYNPIFDRTLEFLDHPSELDPAVIEFQGRRLLYYRRAAPDGSGNENLAVAQSPMD